MSSDNQVTKLDILLRISKTGPKIVLATTCKGRDISETMLNTRYKMKVQQEQHVCTLPDLALGFVVGIGQQLQLYQMYAQNTLGT